MISYENTLSLKQLQKCNPEIYDLFEKIQKDQDIIASRFSHNIKNIISIISSSVQFIESQHPEAENYNLWPQLKDAISYLINFMDQESLFRHCSNIDSKPMNIKDLLWCIPDLMDDIFEDDLSSNIRTYNYDIENDLPSINGDYGKLKFAFIEVLKNAYEATTDDDTITISAHLVNDCIEISFSDNGSGIEQTIISEVINPFFTTKRSHTGTGLSIAYKVAIAHGGSLKIISDNGTCVKFILPL